jgi:RNA polymerase primary sigma factor
MNRAKETQSKETLSLYLKEISRIPLLTSIEEKDLGRRIQNGDEMAVQKLVESNLRFVVTFAKRYRQRGLSFTDLINEGNMGMITAAKRFDPDRNVRFITYAVWWVRQSITIAIANLGRPLKVPIKINNAINRVKVSTLHDWNEGKHNPTMEEIAADACLKEEDLPAIMGLAGVGISLNQP